MLREIRRLPEQQVLEHYRQLYAAGKHKGAAPKLLSQVAGQLEGKDKTWAEVEIPHDSYDADWNTADASLSKQQIDRALTYARTPGPLPPGIALYTGRRLKNKAFVVDGNHRAYAAFLREQPAARFYMPLIQWERFKSAAAG